MASLLGFLTRNYKNFVSSPIVPKDENPVRFGILGAATIAPPALILPCRSHPSAIPYAVAARDLAKAQKFAKQWRIQKAYGGSGAYQELLDDSNVNAVYVALPNGMHFEWAARALKAGKHVLLEKPSTNREEETRALAQLAKEKNLVLLEAFHYRFHPATCRVKEILASKELGEIKSIEANFVIAPSALFSSNDIRLVYELGGGALMDMGAYCIDSIRHLTSMNPTGVISVQQTRTRDSANVDRRTIASLSLPNSATASLACDLAVPSILGIIPKQIDISVRVKCEGGELQFTCFFNPGVYHSITVKPHGQKSRVEKVYKKPGGEEWSTYRFQLEEFVKRVQGRDVDVWIEGSDSAENMKWIEEMYKAGGMGSRPKSSFVL